MGAVVTLIVLIALALAVYAAAASYESLSGEAAVHAVPLPRWMPLSLDGGLFGVIVVDVALTWGRQPLSFLRLVARGFAVGTIAANAAAGWPDPISMSLRVAAPALFVVLVETGRAVLLRRNRAEAGQKPGIPRARWILAPRSSWRLYRRMRLWEMTDYRQALDAELERLEAIDRIAAHFAPADWRKAAPRHLARMLRDGVRMDRALLLVAELTAPAPVPAPLPKRAPARRSTAPRKGAPQRSRSAAADDVTLEARALQLLATDLDMSGTELARRLGVSPGYGRKLRARLTAKDRPGDVTGPQARVRPQERS